MENNKKTIKPKLPIGVKIPLITLIGIISIFLILQVVSLIVTSSNNSYSISFSGVYEFENCTYANFSIDSEDDVTFYAADFSVLVDETPQSASGIYNSNLNTCSATSTVKNTITVKFNLKQEELDSPIKFYYKGKLLEIGNTQNFEN